MNEPHLILPDGICHLSCSTPQDRIYVTSKNTSRGLSSSISYLGVFLPPKEEKDADGCQKGLVGTPRKGKWHVTIIENKHTFLFV